LNALVGAKVGQNAVPVRPVRLDEEQVRLILTELAKAQDGS
jgi:hypothetical protein